MDSIFFGLKRAHHGVLRITRHSLAKVGLTAARFDLMYAVHARRGLAQRELRRVLGVSAPTVSRMLASLEALGLVQRCLVSGCRRRLWVLLTPAGRRCIRRAIGRFIRSGWASLAVDSALCPTNWHDSAGACLYAKDSCETTLNAFREAYGDFATLHYRWHPDD
jgi:DNA-binding MarR family transcriptional regulator